MQLEPVFVIVGLLVLVAPPLAWMLTLQGRTRRRNAEMLAALAARGGFAIQEHDGVTEVRGSVHGVPFRIDNRVHGGRGPLANAGAGNQCVIEMPWPVALGPTLVMRQAHLGLWESERRNLGVEVIASGDPAFDAAVYVAGHRDALAPLASARLRAALMRWFEARDGWTPSVDAHVVREFHSGRAPSVEVMRSRLEAMSAVVRAF